MVRSAKVNFVRQQGFRNDDAPACEGWYSALMFQPRLIGVLVAVGLVLHTWPFFAILTVAERMLQMRPRGRSAAF